MKTLFIPAQRKYLLNKIQILKLSKKLPKNIAIVYSIQYKDLSSEIKRILSKHHNITKITQVLGCSIPKFPKETMAILLIGSGKFHALGLASETNLPIYIWESGKLGKISSKEVNSFRKKQRGSYLKFLNAEKIGVLISTKPGQENLKKALDLRNKVNKKCYFFISNNLSAKEFENFGVDAWINTACPRLDMENSVVNLNRIKNLADYAF